MTFYQSVFGGELTMSTFAEMGSAGDPSDADKIMHSQLETDRGFTLMAADTPSHLAHEPTAGFSVSLSGDDDATLREYWDELAEGGQVGMPLQQAPWGDSFGMCVDRFGIRWLVNIAGAPATDAGAGWRVAILPDVRRTPLDDPRPIISFGSTSGTGRCRTVVLACAARPDEEADMGNDVNYFEIGSPDPAASRAFYGGLFGWEIGEPDGPAPYSMIGQDSGGLWDTSAMGGATWAIFYVQVEDVAAAIQRAQQLGAAVTVPLVDNGAIEFAHLTDPLGNRFGIWRPKSG